jgi:hypothetical protein
MAGDTARNIGRWASVQQRTGITLLSYKAASNPNMAAPRPTPAPAVWWCAAPVLPAADAEAADEREALPEGVVEALPEAVIEALPAAGVPEELPAEGLALLEGVALPDRVALPDGHEGAVLTLIF